MISFLFQREKLAREVCEQQGQEKIEELEEERKALEAELQSLEEKLEVCTCLCVSEQFRMFVSELCFKESLACLLTPILNFYCRGRGCRVWRSLKSQKRTEKPWR